MGLTFQVNHLNFMATSVEIMKSCTSWLKIGTEHMGVLDNLFGEKIVFTDEMNQFIETVKEIEWFKNCGKIYQKELFYIHDPKENTRKY